MSCPSGFEATVGDACRIACPPDFKYIQEADNEKCMSISDNRYFLRLQKIPKTASLTVFTEEQARFFTDFIGLTRRIAKDKEDEEEKSRESVMANDGVAAAYAEAIEELKPLRPPTQPTVDIKDAQLSIREISAVSLKTLQICLFFVVIAFLEYFLLPPSIVHGVAFFTLCVGFSLAIYLSNK
jgi:hypothetical protein